MASASVPSALESSPAVGSKAERTSAAVGLPPVLEALEAREALDALASAQEALSEHPVFARLRDVEAVRTFMELHVFAVWDFMSLVKALQRELTCVSLPWRPSPYPGELVRLLNEIVLGEESDLGPDGRAVSHFELYVRGMREIGADTRPIESFVQELDLTLVPEGARPFVSFTLETVRERCVREVAASFFFGRERVIPGMFQSITEVLRREGVTCPTFLWYLDRHIEIDGEEHGPLAARCLEVLCAGDESRLREAVAFGHQALAERHKLWDAVLRKLPAA